MTDFDIEPDLAEIGAADTWLNRVAARHAPRGDQLAVSLTNWLDNLDREFRPAESTTPVSIRRSGPSSRRAAAVAAALTLPIVFGVGAAAAAPGTALHRVLFGGQPPAVHRVPQPPTPPALGSHPSLGQSAATPQTGTARTAPSATSVVSGQHQNGVPGASIATRSGQAGVDHPPISGPPSLSTDESTADPSATSSSDTPEPTATEDKTTSPPGAGDSESTPPPQPTLVSSDSAEASDHQTDTSLSGNGAAQEVTTESLNEAPS